MVFKNAVVATEVLETSSSKRIPILGAVADVVKVLVLNGTAGITIVASICRW